MWRVMMAALAYWGAVFAPAFALGVIRTLWLTPQIGALIAVMIELPIVLAISWFAARKAVRHWRLRQGEAAAMGVCAFALLMLAEWALARAFGQSGMAGGDDDCAGDAGGGWAGGVCGYALVGGAE
jgi:hypothetical protein